MRCCAPGRRPRWRRPWSRTLAALLVNERALQWEDRVQDLVPALVLKDIDGAGKLRIDDLLSHRV